MKLNKTQKSLMTNEVKKQKKHKRIQLQFLKQNLYQTNKQAEAK
jgi:hypothetical protein